MRSATSTTASIGDALARYMWMSGHNVLHPMGWDAFGLPAENAAIRSGRHPAESTRENIAAIRRQMKRMGWSIDWKRELSTSDPEYYRWTQWLFLKFRVESRAGLEQLEREDLLQPEMSGAVDEADLVHVAAHGTHQQESPLFSSLRMHDGPLTVYDFERLDRALRLDVAEQGSGVREVHRAAVADARRGVAPTRRAAPRRAGATCSVRRPVASRVAIRFATARSPLT